MMRFGQDPYRGEQLGRPYRKFATAAERVERRLGKISDTLTEEEYAAQAALIEVEEAARPTGLRWGTQALIARAHHAAIQDVIDLFERDVAMTRVGAKGARSRRSRSRA